MRRKKLIRTGVAWLLVFSLGFQAGALNAAEISVEGSLSEELSASAAVNETEGLTDLVTGEDALSVSGADGSGDLDVQNDGSLNEGLLPEAAGIGLLDDETEADNELLPLQDGLLSDPDSLYEPEPDGIAGYDEETSKVERPVVPAGDSLIVASDGEDVPQVNMNDAVPGETISEENGPDAQMSGETSSEGINETALTEEASSEESAGSAPSEEASDEIALDTADSEETESEGIPSGTESVRDAHSGDDDSDEDITVTAASAGEASEEAPGEEIKPVDWSEFFTQKCAGVTGYDSLTDVEKKQLYVEFYQEYRVYFEQQKRKMEQAEILKAQETARQPESQEPVLLSAAEDGTVIVPQINEGAPADDTTDPTGLIVQADSAADDAAVADASKEDTAVTDEELSEESAAGQTLLTTAAPEETPDLPATDKDVQESAEEDAAVIVTAADAGDQTPAAPDMVTDTVTAADAGDQTPAAPGTVTDIVAAADAGVQTPAAEEAVTDVVSAENAGDQTPDAPDMVTDVVTAEDAVTDVVSAENAGDQTPAVLTDEETTLSQETEKGSEDKLPEEEDEVSAEAKDLQIGTSGVETESGSAGETEETEGNGGITDEILLSAAELNTFSNQYLEVAVDDIGRFTIGNKVGNPNYDSDDNEILLYGHPSPNTSETLIFVDGGEYYFSANKGVSVDSESKIATAIMEIAEKNVTIIETLEFVAGGSGTVKNSVKISYTAVNSSGGNVQIGARIMLDTMLADNDDAPFKIPGIGNLTTQKDFTGSSIPQSYQVYDDLDNPTTMATGYLYSENGIKPDKVLFTNWRSVRGSSWSYTSREGNSLGDSAVAVVFDPAAVGANKSVQLAETWYGVGIGVSLDNGSKSIKVNGDQFGVIVDQAESGERVPDTEVKICDDQGNELASATTNINGFAVFDDVENKNGTWDSSLVGMKKVIIGGEVFEDVNVEGGKVWVLEIDEDSEKPKIQSVTCGSTNLLSETVTFLADENDVVEKKNSSETVTIKATSDTEGCLFYLLENGSVLYNNNKPMRCYDGVFTFKSYTEGDKTYVKGLSAGKVYSVKCVKPDGTPSKVMTLGIQVREPFFYYELNEWINPFGYSKGNIEQNWVLNLLLGGEHKVGITDNFELFSDYDPASGKLKIGFNAKKDLVKSTSAGENFKSLMSKANKFTTRKSKMSSDALEKEMDKWTKDKKSFSVGSNKISFKVTGYGEGYVNDKNPYIDLSIVIGVFYDGSYSHNSVFIIPVVTIPVPLYWSVGWGVGVKGTVTARLDTSRKLTEKRFLSSMNGSLKVPVYLSIEGGIGNTNVAKGGIQGKGEFEWGKEFPSQYSYGKITLGASLEAEVTLIRWSHSIPLAEGTFMLFEKNAQTVSGQDAGDAELSAAGSNEELSFNYDEMTMEGRDYLNLEEEEEIVPEASLYAADAETESETEAGIPVYPIEDNGWQIDRNQYPDSAPVVLDTTDGQYRFRLDDLTEREAVNGTALSYEYRASGGDWSETVIVDNDQTADYDFQVIADGNKVYAVWEDEGSVLPAGTDLKTALQDLDISWAVIESGQVTGQGTFADNDDQMELIPRVMTYGNTVYIGWLKSARLQDPRPDGSERIRYSVLNGSSFGEPVEKILSGTQTVSDVQFANTQGGLAIAYTLSDVDDQMGMKSQITKYWVLGSADATDPDAPEVLGSTAQNAVMDGQMTMFWFEGGNIHYTIDISAAPSLLFTGDTLPEGLNESFFIFNSASGELCLVWSTSVSRTIDGTEQEDNLIYAMRYKDGSWTAPYVVVNAGPGKVKSLTAKADGDGQMSVSYMKLEYDDDGNMTSSQMVYVDNAERTDIQLLDMDYDENEAAFDNVTPLPLKLYVKNAGSTKIDRINVNVEHNGWGVYSNYYDLSLAPGASGELVINDFILNSSDLENSDHVWTVRAEVDNDADTEDNYMGMTLGYIDLKVAREDTVLQENEHRYKISVSNDSAFAAKNVQFKLLADSREGAVIYDETIGELEGKGHTYLYIPVSLLDGVDTAYAYLTTDSQLEDEDSLFLQIFSADISVIKAEESTLTATASGAGNLTVEYTNEEGEEKTEEGSSIEIPAGTGQTFRLSAQAQDENVFRKWTGNGEGIISDPYNAEMTFTAGDKDATVQAEFLPKLSAQGISADVSEITMLPDEEGKFAKATVTPADSTDFVRYESLDESIVGVDEHTGELTAYAPGEAIVRAYAGDSGYYADIKVVVQDVLLTKLSVGQSNMTLSGPGDEAIIDCIIEPVNATENVIFESDNPSVVTVEEDGTVHGVAPGTANIKVKPEHSSAAVSPVTVQVKVRNPITDIVFDQPDLTMSVGEEKTVRLKVTPENADAPENLSWILPENSSVVEVTRNVGDPNECVVKAIGNGQASVTVIADGRIAYLNVRVITNATGITLNEENLTISKGQYRYLYYSLEPSGAENPVAFSSSDESVVWVDDDGEIYGAAPGTAVVTATTDNGFSDSVTVTVTDNTKVVSSISELQSDHDYSNNTDFTWIYSQSGAVSITLTFSSDTLTEDGYDYIYILDENDNIVGDDGYCGDELAGQSITVPGSTVKIRLRTDSSSVRYGFRVVNLIAKQRLNSTTASVSAIPDQSYTGSAVTPAVTVAAAGKTLRAGSDYTVAYANNINPGTATVTVNGIGNYSGSISQTFRIVLQPLGAVSGITMEAQSKSITLNWTYGSLVSGYKLTRYRKNGKKYNKEGEFNVSAVPYTDTGLKAATYYRYIIQPFLTVAGTTLAGPETTFDAVTCAAKIKLKGSAKGKSKVNLTWKKIKGVSGYEIAASQKKNKGYKTVKTIKKSSTKSATITMKKKGVWYIRIRSYITLNGKKVYSEWSKLKKIKVK